MSVQSLKTKHSDSFSRAIMLDTGIEKKKVWEKSYEETCDPQINATKSVCKYL